MKLDLIRIAQTSKHTAGALIKDGVPICSTLEDAWVNNQRNISCIPTGHYICKITVSPHFGRTFKVQNVPDRSEILFHKGNTTNDTRGCILTGRYFKVFDGEIFLVDSMQGYNAFMQAVGSESFELEISICSALKQ